MMRWGTVMGLGLVMAIGLVPAPDRGLDAAAEEEHEPAASADGFLAYYLALAGELPAERDPGVAELRRAVELRDRDPAAARAAFVRAAELLPGLADWAHVLAADAASRSGDTTAVRQLLANAEPVLAREWGWRAQVRAFRLAENVDAAAALAAEAASRIADPVRAAEAWRSTGDLRQQRGDITGSKIAYRAAIDLAAGSEQGLAAARALTALPEATPDDHLLVGRLYLRHGNLDRGIGGIDTFIRSGRATADEIGELRLGIARALFRAGRHDEAERRLTALLETGSAAPWAAEAMLLLGRAQFRAGRRDAARATFMRTAERHPTAEAAAEALFIVADLEHDDGRLARARELYARAVDIAPVSAAGANAALRLGSIALTAGDPAMAVRVFERLREAQEDSRRRQQALFWAARALRSAGQEDLARERFRETQALDPASYYGMRAADLLADGSWRSALAPTPERTTRSELESSGALFRLDVLREVGLNDAAAYEIERLRRYHVNRDDALYALAEAFLARDQIFLGISIGREIQRNEGQWNERLLRIVYPFPYQDEIVAEARRQGVDPYLIAGLIRQESMFNTNAVSPAGAIGLMQVMPATGRGLATGAGIRNFQPSMLRDPETNIRLGVRYMAQLLRQYDDRLPDLLAAYNAGPSRLARWRAFPEYGDDDLFAERIPFAETRDYVKVVQQNRRIYEALYGPRGAGTAYGP